MKIIGVIDLFGGRAVHARGGQRDRYAPIDRVCRSPIAPGDAVTLAREYADRFRIAELYVADLDAIIHGTPQDTVLRTLAPLAAALWLDAGVSTAAQARRASERGASRVVVGLETLSSYDALAEISREIGDEHVAFSLDLRDGIPIVASGARVQADSPAGLAARAVDAGATAVILLDLARVGTAQGVDLATCSTVRRAVPGVTLMAGGGVRDFDDLARLADAGCDGVLLATALLDGRLDAADVARARLLTSALGPRLPS